MNSHKKKVIAERKKQGLKLGDSKVSRTGNELDKIKELKKKHSNLKSGIKSLKNKVTNYNDEGYDNEETDDSGDQFLGKQSKKNIKLSVQQLHSLECRIVSAANDSSR